jgi:hypothetical protein
MTRFFLALALIGGLIGAGACNVLAGVGDEETPSALVKVPAQGSKWFNHGVHAGRPVAITVVGDGNTNLDLYVYDQAGGLVAKAEGGTDEEQVRFVPLVTQTYRIELRNLGRTYNQVQVRVE